MIKKISILTISFVMLLGVIFYFHPSSVAKADVMDMFKIDTSPTMDNKTFNNSLLPKTEAEKKTDKMIEEQLQKKNKNYKKRRQSAKQEKAYAKYMFDDSAKNQTLMYYKKQTNSDAKTVESIIDEKSVNGDGKPYATFLNTLNTWNLYKTYTNQAEVGGSIITKGIKAIYGGILLGCMYLMAGLDKIMALLGQLFDYLNIFQYLTNEQGDIPKDSPFYGLNPLVHTLQKMTVVAKILITIFLGWIAFRLATGIGRARNRGMYFKSGITKILMAMFSVAFSALIISGCFGLISDMLKNASGVSSNAVEKIPEQVIVDTQQYIDNSLTKIKGKKGAEGTNGGYILNHDSSDFPKKPEDMVSKIPSQKLVEYMNTDNNSKIAEELDGKRLLRDWAFSTSYNSVDLDSMYGMSKDNSNMFKNGKDLATQFKLAPGPQGVKLFGGKEFFSFDLKDISIESASLVGNTAFGQFLNAIKLGAMIIGITFVVCSLFLAVVKGLFNAVKEWIANYGLSQVGFYQAFFGIFITAMMILMNIGLFFGIISQYPQIVTATDSMFTETLNKDNTFGGVEKQLIQTVVSLFGLWACSLLAFKLHKGVLTMVGTWFTHILERLNPDAGFGGGSNSTQRALQNALGSNTFGNETASNIMQNPIESGKNGIQNGVQSLKNLKQQGEEKANSLKSMIQGDEEGEGNFNNDKGHSSSRFSGRVSSKDRNDDYQDANEQGEKIEEDLQQGLSELEQQGDKQIDRNLSNQEKSVAEAREAFGNLRDADDELQEAKNNYKQLQEDGASEEELDNAKARVDDAQSVYDKQLGLAQNASQSLAKSGATVGDIAKGKAQSMQDYQKAGQELQDAEKNLQELQDEKEEMKTYGAAPNDLKLIEQRISEAKDKVDLAQQKQSLAKQAYDANVNNPTMEKDARNDLIAANQAQVAAQREFSEAKAHGNLNQKQYSDLQQAATSIKPDVEQQVESIDQKVKDAENQQHAIQFMKNNGGNAFAKSDYGVQADELERADDKVSQLQKDIVQAKKEKQPKGQLQALNNELANAQAHYANVQTASNTMETGLNASDGLNAQQQVVSQAFKQRVDAEKALNGLRKQENAGQLIDRTTMKDAESNYLQALSQHQHAERVLSGIQAVSSLGSTTVSPQNLQTMATQNTNELEQLAKEQSQARQVQGTIATLGSGGKASADETSHLSTMQKRIRKDKSAKAKQATDDYNATVEKLTQLKRQLKNGMPVQSEIKNVEASARQAKKKMNTAIEQEQFIAHQGSVIRKTGRTMVENMKAAKQNITDQSSKVTERRIRHQDILKTGGLSTEQLQSYKKSITEDRRQKDNNKQQFLRERASRISEIRKNLGFD